MKIKIYPNILRGVYASMLALLVLSFVVLPVMAAPRSSEPDIAKIDAFINAQMQANRLPGLALGIVHGDQIVHMRGFGVADPTGRSVTPQTPFLLGSVTKSFTALAIMQLVEAGKVRLDAPVQKYLPWFRVADSTASARITVRNLLNHTSGMPTGTKEGAALRTETLEQFVRSLSTVALTAPVGTTFQYCNANYMTLGLIIQTITGQDYGTYIQQHVFAPLQMQSSFVSVEQAKQHGMAQSYHWAFGVPYPVDDADLHLPAILPAGLLISTAEDMTHYLVAQMNGGRYGSTTILSPADIDSMHAPATAVSVLGPGTSYGMGWFNGPVGGVPAAWHDGITGAFHTYMIIEPQNHWGAIMLMNAFNLVADFGAFQQLQAGLARLLAGQEPQATGLSLSTFYLIIEVILALISIGVLWSVLRLRHWRKQFEQRLRRRPLRLGWRLFLELILPVAFLLGFPAMLGLSWLNLVYFNPDLGYWLLGICAISIIVGIIRVVLAIRVLRRKKTNAPQVSPSPTPNLV